MPCRLLTGTAVYDVHSPLPLQIIHVVTCILRKQDIFRFCGGIPGLDPDCYAPQMLGDQVFHTLVLRNPEARLPPAPKNLSIRIPSHRRLLEEYQRALSGSKGVAITQEWPVVELDQDMTSFVNELAKKIMLSNPSRIDSTPRWWRLWRRAQAYIE